MTETNTSYDVLVLGDRETALSTEMLAEKAADKGAVITQIFSFDAGEPVVNDDLADIEAVVAALSLAIVSRTDIWLPFPLQDMCREQHFRRLSLALQRHGLNLLMGQELAPCPVEGGYNEVDAALRKEVRAVDELDYAALAAAGVRALGAEIEVALVQACEQPAALCEPGDEPPFDDVGAEERYFGSSEAAAYFGKSAQWISWGLREKVFIYPDGSAVEPIRIGKGGRRRFTVAMLRAIAWSCYRRGNLSHQQLQGVLAELSRAER